SLRSREIHLPRACLLEARFVNISDDTDDARVSPVDQSDLPDRIDAGPQIARRGLVDDDDRLAACGVSPRESPALLETHAHRLKESGADHVHEASLQLA